MASLPQELPRVPETLQAILIEREAEIERLRQIIKELQRHRFGRWAETLPEDQLLLWREAIVTGYLVLFKPATTPVGSESPKNDRCSIELLPNQDKPSKLYGSQNGEFLNLDLNFCHRVQFFSTKIISDDQSVIFVANMQSIILKSWTCLHSNTELVVQELKQWRSV